MRLGAKLGDAKDTVINRGHARAWLPQTLAPRGTLDVPIEIMVPETPGRYTLKFDLVSERIDWFEACGSQTTSRSLVTW